MRRFRRARRPLIALVVLVLALVIGYLVQSARAGDGGHRGDPRPGAVAAHWDGALRAAHR